jgi:hypothetical protein
MRIFLVNLLIGALLLHNKNSGPQGQQAMPFPDAEGVEVSPATGQRSEIFACQRCHYVSSTTFSMWVAIGSGAPWYFGFRVR